MRRSPLQTTSFAIAEEEEEEEEEEASARRVLGANEVRREEQVEGMMDETALEGLEDVRDLRGR